MSHFEVTYYKENNYSLLPKFMDEGITLGEKIKYFRKRAGLSQLDLEVAIDASAGSISRIENNVINPTKETILDISDALNLHPIETAYLFGIMIFSKTI